MVPKSASKNEALEWYVMAVANRPTKIYLGRREALFFFSYGFTLTQRERYQLTQAFMNGVKLGEPILLTGYETGKGRMPDRTLTRVPGPMLYEAMP